MEFTICLICRGFFDPLHIPNRGKQMVRYYGYYSNKSRGIRKKVGKDDAVPSLIECDVSHSAFPILDPPESEFLSVCIGEQGIDFQIINFTALSVVDV